MRRLLLDGTINDLSVRALFPRQDLLKIQIVVQVCDFTGKNNIPSFCAKKVNDRIVVTET